MPRTGLKGSYTLDNETIDRVVTRKSAGAYVLGHVEEREEDKEKKKVFIIEYVGRSDDDVNDRLKDWVGKYSRFKYDYFGSAKAAFEKECDLWHDWGGPEGVLDNERHPDRPEGTDWKCPRCNVFD